MRGKNVWNEKSAFDRILKTEGTGERVTPRVSCNLTCEPFGVFPREEVQTI